MEGMIETKYGILEVKIPLQVLVMVTSTKLEAQRQKLYIKCSKNCDMKTLQDKVLMLL